MKGVYFKNAAERWAWAIQSYTRMITLAVNYNPSGTYQAIKRHFKDFPNWAPGILAESQKQRMYDFLKAQAENSGNPEQFARELLNAIRSNPDMDHLWITL